MSIDGFLIRLFRISQGWTLEEFARELNTSPESAWRWENEIFRPTQPDEINIIKKTGELGFDFTEYQAGSTIAGALSLIDKDETKNHCYRVAGLAEKIGIRLGIGKTKRIDLVDLIYCAVCHDLGKIAVGDIVAKKGKLTLRERDTIREHAEKTYVILQRIAPGDRARRERIATIASQHHENADGTGYPWGIKNPPLEAMIIRCADEYDARVSVRCYRKGKNKKAPAWKVIEDMINKPHQLYPKVMKALREAERYRINRESPPENAPQTTRKYVITI